MARNSPALVSVITPAFNAEMTLPYAIESVLNQNYSDFELILVDDASTDGTLWVAEYYARQDRRIKVLQNPCNSRQGTIEWEPRNDALRLAQGSVIGYLDADNTWRPDFLRILTGILLEHDGLQLVHCDSYNHYSPEEKRHAVLNDCRKLVSQGETWTVFSHDELDVTCLGREQYIDTNEIVHRATIFKRLHSLWRTTHPRRTEINQCQGSLRPYRRHNDLDLFERVLAEFGIDAAFHAKEVLVDFYYPSYCRPKHRVTTAVPQRKNLHKQFWIAASDLIVDTGSSSAGNISETASGLDLGVGEIGAIPGVDLDAICQCFWEADNVAKYVGKYFGSSAFDTNHQAIADYYNHWLGRAWFNSKCVVPCDGCTDAIHQALALFAGTHSSSIGKNGVAFAVPGYPYWKIAAAGGHVPIPLECYDGDSFLEALATIDEEVIGAVILPWPNNPLGYSLSSIQTHLLACMARERNWGILLDVAYDAFWNRSSTTPLLALPKDKTVLCASVSKSWALPGIRLGFALIPDPEIAALLRARKNGQSMAPSNLTQALFGFVIREFADIPVRVAAAVQDRRLRLRAALETAPLVTWGVELLEPAIPGPYEVLFVDGFCDEVQANPLALAEALVRRVGVRVRTTQSFFPPKWHPVPRRRFFRLSVGAVENIEPAATRLLQFLESVWRERRFA